jgi:hypothetical protein
MQLRSMMKKLITIAVGLLFLVSCRSPQPTEKGRITLSPTEITVIPSITSEPTTTPTFLPSLTPTASITPEITPDYSQEFLDEVKRVRLIFQDEEGNIRFWNGEDLQILTNITKNGQLYLTPSGERFVFVPQMGTLDNIWVGNTDGSGVEHMKFDPDEVNRMFENTYYEFSVMGIDNFHLFIGISVGDDYEIDLNTGAIDKIHSYIPAGGFRILSPDLSKLAVFGVRSIAIYELKSNNPIGIMYFQQTKACCNEGPWVLEHTWTDDSQWLIYAVPPVSFDNYEDSITTIWRMSALDGKIELMTHVHTDTLWGLALYTTGDWIGYSTTDQSGIKKNYIKRLDGSFEYMYYEGGIDSIRYKGNDNFVYRVGEMETEIHISSNNQVELSTTYSNYKAGLQILDHVYELHNPERLCDLAGLCITFPYEIRAYDQKIIN